MDFLKCFFDFCNGPVCIDCGRNQNRLGRTYLIQFHGPGKFNNKWMCLYCLGQRIDKN